jgi:protein TonB
MKPKKTTSANLENKRPILIPLGLVIAFSITLLAFEWVTTKQNNEYFTLKETGRVITTEIEPLRPPEPPEQQAPPPVHHQIEPVENDYEGELENIEINVNIDPNERINFFPNNPEPTDTNEKIPYVPPWQLNKEPAFKCDFRAKIATLIQNNLPEITISGTVYTSFMVNPDGSISNIQIMRGLEPRIDKVVKEAIQCVDCEWEPGEQMGKKVKTSFSLPVRIEIEQ